MEARFASAKPCVLILVIDSYDDILQYAKESEKAQVSAEVEKVLESFMTGTNGIIRKIENDMFYAVVETRHLRVMMQEKFKVLDDARKILVNGRIHITFSIGVDSSEFARRERKICSSVAGYGIGTRR